MTNDDPVTRRGVLAGAAATAALAATRATAQRGRNDDLTKLSIEEASRRIAAGDLSPVDLTQAYLDRIESVDPKLNSFITVLADEALADARRRAESSRAASAGGRCTAFHSGSRTTSTLRAFGRRPRAPCTPIACRPRTRSACASCATPARSFSAS